jgi:hypothetical protein
VAFEFLPLSYDFNDLRPAMTEKAARWHHDVVHGAYLAAINRLLSQYPDFNGLTIEQVLSQPQRLPDNLREDVRVQGGGHAIDRGDHARSRLRRRRPRKLRKLPHLIFDRMGRGRESVCATGHCFDSFSDRS